MKKNTDAKQVASKELYEVYYISYRFKIPVKDVRAAIKKAGRSRKKVYANLREMGYTIQTKYFKQ